MTTRSRRPAPQSVPRGPDVDAAHRELLDTIAAGPRPPCQGTDRDAWTSDDPGDHAQAATACLFCPHRTPCRDYALAAREHAGVWGATTPTHRFDPAAALAATTGRKTA